MNNTLQTTPQMEALRKLVGTWNLSGDTTGTVTYAWLHEGIFLKQEVELELFGRPVRATEIIGHLKPFGQEASPDVHSRAYDSEGNTLDYIYELEGDVLTIWGGQIGSPAYYRGTFSADGNHVTGGWVYPGGGYKSDMSRSA